MKRPNFFIVGAPKCGTTALHEYLGGHPNVFMARKEPHFFATDLSDRGVTALGDYLKLFEAAGNEHLAVGEASVWYFHSQEALRNIHDFDPNARIIAMLRNPVDLIYSWHSQLVFSLMEDEKDFEKAWRLQAERARGNKLPQRCPYPGYLDYARVGRLSGGVERILGIFPPERVKLVLFDDFVQSTRTVYEDVLAFLGVAAPADIDFTPRNENKTYRLAFLAGLLREPPPFLRRSVRTAERLLRTDRLRLIDTVRRLNTNAGRRKPLSPAFRRELITEFSDDIDRLARLLGRDLDSWKSAGREAGTRP